MQPTTLDAVVELAQALPYSEQLRLTYALLPVLAAAMQEAASERKSPIVPGRGTPERVAALLQSWVAEGDEVEQRATLVLLMEAFGEDDWLSDVPQVDPDVVRPLGFDDIWPRAQALPRTEQLLLVRALLPQVAPLLRSLDIVRTLLLEHRDSSEYLRSALRAWIGAGDDEEQREMLDLLLEALGRDSWRAEELPYAVEPAP